MDLIDRAELKKLPSVQLFGTVRTVDIDNAQKVDAVPMSVIEEIKSEIEESSCGSWYVQNPDKTLEKEILVRMVDVLGIIDKRVKEHTS